MVFAGMVFRDIHWEMVCTMYLWCKVIYDFMCACINHDTNLYWYYEISIWLLLGFGMIHLYAMEYRFDGKTRYLDVKVPTIVAFNIYITGYDLLGTCR